jgi:uncharacterized protein YbjT (DUF2867 family)
MFMSNTLQGLPQLQAGNVVRAPFPAARAAVTDPADIAAVAAVALTGPGHEEQTYELSGPEAFTAAQRLAVLGQVLGRDLRFEAQSDEDARTEMSADTPAEYVDAFFDFYAGGPVARNGRKSYLSSKYLTSNRIAPILGLCHPQNRISSRPTRVVPPETGPGRWT